MTNTTDKKALRLFSMPWWFAIAAILVVYLATYLGALSTDMGGTLALMLAIAIPLNEIGKRIPIWNKYVGGGLVLTFLGTAILVYYNVIP
ncbi:MAG TPA: 2-hydroxycarboxylate transporter family protein, partial [Proteiniclasticum sp.]|nr:2-hydroxycarboxylate transporter family protein [Proteiniclasticum sp.]